MSLGYEPPNDRLMAELLEVRRAVQDVQQALRQTNRLPDDFEIEALEDLLSALKILPEGTAAGAHTTLRTNKTELQDFEDRHFLTRAESEQQTEDTLANADKPSRHSKLGKEFRLLKSACDSALSECRRQAGTAPNEEEPPQDEQRIDTDPKLDISERLKANAGKIVEAMRLAHDEIDGAVDDDIPEKDIVTRVLKDTEHLSLTTRAVASLKTKSQWAGQQLSKAWGKRYDIIIGSMNGLKAVNGLTKYGWDRVSKVRDDMRHVLHDHFTEVADDIKGWAQKQKQPLPPIPDIDPDVQKQAEAQAVALLKAGKPIPPEIGINVRRLGGLFDRVPLDDLALLAHSPYLTGLHLDKSQATDFSALSAHQYLDALSIPNSAISDKTLNTLPKQLQSLDLNGTPITDLSPLSALSQLQSLDLSGTQITDLSPLSALSQLQDLDLGSTQITDLTPLSALSQLQSLDLDRTQITDLTPLAHLKNLGSLWAIGLKVSDWSPVDHVMRVSGHPDRDKKGLKP